MFLPQTNPLIYRSVLIWVEHNILRHPSNEGISIKGYQLEIGISYIIAFATTVYPSVPAAFVIGATVSECTRRIRRVRHAWSANIWWILTVLSMRYGKEAAGNYEAGVKEFHREGVLGFVER